MGRIKRKDVKISLIKDTEEKKELLFSMNDIDWLKMEISTCADNNSPRMFVRFRITPARDEEKCICMILFCTKLRFCYETLRIENNRSYVERIREWFKRIDINFPSDRECVIEMATVTPSPVRLRAAVMFTIEVVAASLISGLVERKKMKNVDKKLKEWMSNTFSNGYSIKTTWEKRQEKKAQKESEEERT